MSTSVLPILTAAPAAVPCAGPSGRVASPGGGFDAALDSAGEQTAPATARDDHRLAGPAGRRIPVQPTAEQGSDLSMPGATGGPDGARDERSETTDRPAAVLPLLDALPTLLSVLAASGAIPTEQHPLQPAAPPAGSLTVGGPDVQSGPVTAVGPVAEAGTLAAPGTARATPSTPASAGLPASGAAPAAAEGSAATATVTSTASAATSAVASQPGSGTATPGQRIAAGTATPAPADGNAAARVPAPEAAPAAGAPPLVEASPLAATAVPDGGASTVTGPRRPSAGRPAATASAAPNRTADAAPVAWAEAPASPAPGDAAAAVHPAAPVPQTDELRRALLAGTPDDAGTDPELSGHRPVTRAVSTAASSDAATPMGIPASAAGASTAADPVERAAAEPVARPSADTNRWQTLELSRAGRHLDLHLDGVDIHASLDGDTINMTLHAADAHLRGALRSAAGELRHELLSSGVQLGTLDVGQHSGNPDRAPAAPAPSTASRRPSSGISPAEPVPHPHLTTTCGLDIRA